MKKKVLFKGACTALITPFDKSGNINYFKLKELIEFQISNGINAILILGTTGESPTITLEEREKMIKFCKYEISGRVPLIVGCGSNSTQTAINYLKQAEMLGADGALVVTPYYNKCSQQGLILHYSELAKQTLLPIIVYNVPSRTGLNILPETVLKLSKIKNIVGIKEASGNISQIAKLCHILPKDFAVYSGDDNLTLSMMSLGAVGVVSVSSNAEPEKVSLLCFYALQKDFVNAQKMHKYLFDLSESLFLDVNPICIKTYMNLTGFDVGNTRLPLCLPNAKVVRVLKRTAKKYEN